MKRNNKQKGQENVMNLRRIFSEFRNTYKEDAAQVALGDGEWLR